MRRTSDPESGPGSACAVQGAELLRNRAGKAQLGAAGVTGRERAGGVAALVGALAHGTLRIVARPSGPPGRWRVLAAQTAGPAHDQRR